MAEMISISREKLEILQSRLDKLAKEKSYGQLIVSLMNNMGTAPGLENTIENMLRHVLDIIGGANLILYYTIDNVIYYTDVYGKKMQLAQIDDPLVKEVWESRKPIEEVQDFSDTMMTTPEFTKAYTWVFPLLVGPELIGVFKMERLLQIPMLGLYSQLPPFFNYAALIIKNAILGQTRLQKAYQALEQEIIVRKQIEEDLREANKTAEAASRAKSAFLANMSHELRTPLNAVLGFSRLMQDDPQSTSSQQEKLDIINRSGKHLLTLINDVLDMSKIEAGRTLLETRPFDLGELVRDVVDMMRVRAEEKGLQLLLEQSSRFPRVVDGDAPKLRQILINLLSNAVKFTDQGGVTLRLTSRPGSDAKQIELLCEVEDSGPGIAAEDLKRIFKPFAQLGEQNGQEGTGLGLTITRQYVELMGGRISVESEPGKGALFRFSLPVRKALENDIAALSPAPGRVAGLAPDQPEYRILIAEDQPDNLLLLKTLLENAGFTTRGAENGKQAVELFEQWRPQLILMDWRMPVMDGMEATKRIRALPHGKEPRIVALTASAFTDERNEIMASGHDEYISKPFRAEEIFGCLRRLLGVEFIYVEGAELVTTGELPEAVLQVSAGQLQALSPALFGALHRAVIELDVEHSKALIGEIAEVDPSLATGLLHYVDALEFRSLQRLLEHSVQGGSATADAVTDHPENEDA
jgi:signal transduction histidine kinase/DNA-binding NarL/FixJ family response regulator